MKRFVIGNWKANPLSQKRASTIIRGIKAAAKNTKKVQVVVIPPTPFLVPAKKEIATTKSILLGAQDLFWEESGAFTGKTTPQMIKDVGAKYVIVGHSELRATGDTDDIVNKKIRAAIKAKLQVILCVGEKKRDGEGNFIKFIREQLQAALVGIKPKDLEQIVIAYEPIWAIGTGKVADESTALEMILLVRHTLTQLYSRKSAEKVTVLYGGSVNAKNCSAFLTHPEIGGFLVGGASLQPKEFSSIIYETGQRT